MSHFSLTENCLSQLVFDNHQKINNKNYFCHCLDDYLKINQKTSFFLPGGDLGQLAILFSAANSYGFKINENRLLRVYFDFLSKEENFYLEKNCHYFHLIKTQPEKFSLNEKNFLFLGKLAQKVKKNPPSFAFQKENQPQGVVFIKGDETIPSGIFLEIESFEGKKTIEVFLLIFHQTLFQKRQIALVKKLLKEKVVELYPGLEDNYLTMALIETGENHFYEYINHYTKNLPLYQITFQKNSKTDIKNLGKVVGL